MIAKLHTYAGLLTFVNLMVFGIVGLSAALAGPKTAGAWQVRELPLRLEPGLTGRAAAEQVCAALGLTQIGRAHV